MKKPKKITVRPAYDVEGGGIVVWIYHRQAQVQLQFVDFHYVTECIDEALVAWEHAMGYLT